MNNYKIMAIGWGMFVSAHLLTREENTYVRKWCLDNDFDDGAIPGNLGKVLPEYDPYSPNSWKLGTVPLLELNRFFLLHPQTKTMSPLTAPLIRSSSVKLKRVKDADKVVPLKIRNNRLLVYFKEFKGTCGVWKLKSDSEPLTEKFTISYSKFSLGSDSFYYVTGLRYGGETLICKDSGMDLQFKTSYSKLL